MCAQQMKITLLHGTFQSLNDWRCEEEPGYVDKYFMGFLRDTVKRVKICGWLPDDEYIKMILGAITLDNGHHATPFESVSRELVGAILTTDGRAAKKLLLNDSETRKSVLAIIFGHNNYDEDTMYSGLRVLDNLNIPEDIIIWFDNVIIMLLQAISTIKHKRFQLLALDLLTKMVIYETSSKKQEIGNSGAIKILIKIVTDQIINLDRQLKYMVFYKSWKCLQLLIEEVPSNCKLFIKNGGLKCVLKCITTLPEDSKVLHVAMELVLDVARSKELRHRLIQDDYIKVFSDLLLSTVYDVKTSFKAACITVHLFYDNNETWPKRQEVLDCVLKASKIWEKADDARIDFEVASVDSILRIAQVRLVPQCTYWAAWTLANLTNKNPGKHCPTIIEKDGLQIVRDLLKESNATRLLAQQTIINCESFMKPLYTVKPKMFVPSNIFYP